MADMFDAEMTTAEAVSRLTAMYAGQDSVPANAAFAVLEDRERLVAVATMAKQCRESQKRYFKDRTDEALQTAKDLERKLDAMLKD